jgi:phosphohistidine phosphatase
MRVVLVRHGEAVDSRVASSDQDRWLTDDGRRTVHAVGKTLARMDLRFTQVLTSPLLRAVQTAEILTTAQTGFDGPVTVHRALASEEGTTAQALEPLDEALDDDLIVMVTHMPKVGMIAAQLSGLGHPPAFSTSSACLVEIDAGKGRARWMLDPTSLELHRF